MALRRTLPVVRGPSLNPLQRDLIEAVAFGRIDRRAFLRRGTVLGIALPQGFAILAALGLAMTAAPSKARAASSPGGTLRVGQLVPGEAIEPLRVSSLAGIVQLSATGEYLCLNLPGAALRPWLAESWSSNDDATVWTFKLRGGVTFHNGKPMTAGDVVATFERLADPDSGSNALNLLAGYLSKGGTRKSDEQSVEFHLDAAHGNFPYLVSSDNYNAIIIPEDYQGGFESSFVATGPYKLEKYTPRSGSSFVRNESYWATGSRAERIEYKFFADAASQIQAIEAGEIDILQALPLRLSAKLASNPAISIIAVASSAHHQLHMRGDLGPFRDPRVRRAVALCLDRPALIKTLAGGFADLGNDSPLAPAFAFTDGTVPQRAQDIAQAKSLMAEAGLAQGFSAKLRTETYLEIPDYARAIQEAVKPIGGRIDLDILDQSVYYGDGVFGKSPWLDAVMGITDYDHRGLPNVCLTASLGGGGAWNAARYRNLAYDKLVADFVAAVDVNAQRQAAGAIERMLLDDTPVIFAYFHKALTAVRKGVSGVQTTASGHLLLASAGLDPVP
jgi:peptide/nickel transport system substrate-binding protein